MARRLLTLLLLACIGPSVGLTWVEAEKLSLIGQHFQNLPSRYARLPREAQSKVRDAIWGLSLDSAGLAVAFESNASSISVAYELTKASLAWDNMPASGVSGVDLWAADPSTGSWRWVAITKPVTQNISQGLLQLQPRGTPCAVWPSRWLLYFPLYNAVSSLRIGVPEGSSLGPCSGDCGLGLGERPVVWYGSSITQGACASKPGDAYTNAIARALRRPVANFGFAGNCFYEPEVVDFLLAIDAALYVVDCNPNSEALGFDFVHNRSVALVRYMRQRKPNVTIVLASGTKMGPVWLEGTDNQHARGTRALSQAYDELVTQGLGRGLSFVDVDGSYAQPDGGIFWEMTVDGLHPSSLGMERITHFWAPILLERLTY
mmetsp:Transcript_94466/g.305642  ORF Transcript_94466/g.305642 Transcript_94466/m.305642 type:complete len:375 (+) Transcript_94466:185-1309(+)